MERLVNFNGTQYTLSDEDLASFINQEAVFSLVQEKYIQPRLSAESTVVKQSAVYDLITAMAEYLVPLAWKEVMAEEGFTDDESLTDDEVGALARVIGFNVDTSDVSACASTITTGELFDMVKDEIKSTIEERFHYYEVPIRYSGEITVYIKAKSMDDAVRYIEEGYADLDNDYYDEMMDAVDYEVDPYYVREVDESSVRYETVIDGTDY